MLFHPVIKRTYNSDISHYQNPQCIMYFLSDTWKSNKLNTKTYKENEKVSKQWICNNHDDSQVSVKDIRPDPQVRLLVLVEDQPANKYLFHFLGL